MIAGKKDAIEEWASKGAEWCAKRLWDAKEETKRAISAKESYRKEVKELEIRNELSRTINAENEILRMVLEENGIRPRQLILWVEDKPCDTCQELFGEDTYCMHEGECRKEDVKLVLTVSWYVFRISDGYINGITSRLKSKGYNCTKIVDGRSDAVLYEAKTEEDK